MTTLTAKHLTKDEIVKCNAILNSVANIHSCLYQAIEKNVMEFINAKDALNHSLRNYEQFKNNGALVEQVTGYLTKAELRFATAKSVIGF